MHSEIRWLSRGKVLERFLLPEICTFLDSKGTHQPELKDPDWIMQLTRMIWTWAEHSQLAALRERQAFKWHAAGNQSIPKQNNCSGYLIENSSTSQNSEQQPLVTHLCNSTSAIKDLLKFWSSWRVSLNPDSVMWINIRRFKILLKTCSMWMSPLLLQPFDGWLCPIIMLLWKVK